MFKVINLHYDAGTGSFDEEVLNKFALSHRLISHRSEFFLSEGKPCWTVFLEYDPGLAPGGEASAVRLNEPQKVLHERLKIWRKEKAEDSGVPVYIVATNKELLDIVVKAPETMEGLKSVKGYGRKKIEKYGREILGIVDSYYSKA